MVQLFAGKEVMFRKVFTLADDKERTRAILQRDHNYDGGDLEEILGLKSTPEGEKMEEKERLLDDYLMSLPFEDVKMIQTVMYLGRDKDYNSSHTPRQIYEDYFGTFDAQGWSDKGMEVNQMTDKSPLADYIRDGLAILRVSV